MLFDAKILKHGSFIFILICAKNKQSLPHKTKQPISRWPS